MTKARVVLISAPRGKAAESLAKGLVAARLAACATVLPAAVSHYRWKGKAVRGREALLVVKTTAARVAALTRWVAANHPYDVPEVLALSVDAGHAPYLDWLAKEAS